MDPTDIVRTLCLVLIGNDMVRLLIIVVNGTNVSSLNHFSPMSTILYRTLLIWMHKLHHGLVLIPSPNQMETGE